MFFYLCLPLAITALRLRRRSGTWRIAAIALVALTIASWSAALGNGHVRMIMFMCGMLVHEAIQGRRMQAPSDAVAVAALVLGLLGTLLPVVGHIKSTLLFVSLFMVCVNCFLRPCGALAQVFSWTPLRWLGNISYSYYLLHGLTLKAFFMLLPQPVVLSGHAVLVFLALLPLTFLLTLISSAGLFLLVERPFSLAPTRTRVVSIPT